MDDLSLIIKQPQFCKGLGDEVWQYLVHDLKNDTEFGRLCRRYYGAVADYEVYTKAGNSQFATKAMRHLTEIRRQIDVRTEGYAKYWVKKYGSMQLSVKEVVQVLEGDAKEKFILRAVTAMFLADFIEDCFVEMNACIKQSLPDASYEPLKDFFTLQKKISAYIRQILDGESEQFQELFDEHAAGIKMTIYNKVNGFLGASGYLVTPDNNKQLTFDFKEEGNGIDKTNS